MRDRSAGPHDVLGSQAGSGTDAASAPPLPEVANPPGGGSDLEAIVDGQPALTALRDLPSSFRDSGLRSATATHALHDLAELGADDPVAGLTRLHTRPRMLKPPGSRRASTTHALRDLAEHGGGDPLPGLTRLPTPPRVPELAQPRRATRTHALHDLVELDGGDPFAGLTRLRTLPRAPEVPNPRRATATHTLRDLTTIFCVDESADRGDKRIRICVVDPMLQTGGAEWFAAQLAMAANSDVFEFIFVTYNSSASPIAKHLAARGLRVLCASGWRRGSFKYSDWLEEELFDLLDRLNPDQLFFSSQYLFERLPQAQLARFEVVVRISNFHADELGATDFSRATKVICCTDEQHDCVRRSWPGKAVLIKTGVDTELFEPLPQVKRDDLKRGQGVEGKQVVLFVGRLGSALKRVGVFEDVVRRVNAERSDVAFLAVGYFSAHDGANEEAFRRFVEAEGVEWRQDVAPWDMPGYFQMADILLSTSAEYEGLSNTVLQALATRVVPVTTASAGMQELIEGGDTGFLAEGFEPEAIVAALTSALETDASTRVRLGENGRRKVMERFDFTRCAVDYQRNLMQVHRAAPTRVCITDGSFGIGGAEWLAAGLILNSDPRAVRFDLVVHHKGSPLVDWLEGHGVRVHEAPPWMHYDAWRSNGMADAFRSLRPDVVTPCTIMSWPAHEPFYRLLVISQNAADARRLTIEQYEQADWVLCVSEEVKDQLSREHQWKMSVLHNSIDVELFSRDDESRRQIRDRLGVGGGKVVLWCGRMHEPHKRVDVLMGVIDGMRADPDVHFLVVGYFRDDEQDGRQAWCEFLEAHPNVSWVPHATPWEMPQYYSAADIYLSTSGFRRADFEGLSLTSVQALAAGLPIVTTMSGGQQEVVEQGVNGRLTDPGDVAALIAAIQDTNALDPQRLGEVRCANRTKARELFDIREHTRVYARLARLLKNTVGTALTADPDLPTPHYDFADDQPEGLLRRASSFLHYTWALVPRMDPADLASGVTRVAPDDLRAAAGSVPPGGWLMLPDLGPARETPAGDSDHRPSATAICRLLDSLDSSFPSWAACARLGPHFLLQKR